MKKNLVLCISFILMLAMLFSVISMLSVTTVMAEDEDGEEEIIDNDTPLGLVTIKERETPLAAFSFDSPQTGDNTAFFIALASLAALGAAVFTFTVKKSRSKSR